MKIKNFSLSIDSRLLTQWLKENWVGKEISIPLPSEALGTGQIQLLDIDSIEAISSDPVVVRIHCQQRLIFSNQEIQTQFTSHMSMDCQLMGAEKISYCPIQFVRIKFEEESEWIINEATFQIHKTLNQLVDWYLPKINELLCQEFTNQVDPRIEKYFHSEKSWKTWDKKWHWQLESHHQWIFNITHWSDVISSQLSQGFSVELRPDPLMAEMIHIPIPAIPMINENLTIGSINILGQNLVEIWIENQNSSIRICLLLQLVVDLGNLQFEVIDIQMPQSGLLKKFIFSLGKDAIKRKIESISINLAQVLRQKIKDLLRPFPFVQLNQEIQDPVQLFSIDPEKVTIEGSWLTV